MGEFENLWLEFKQSPYSLKEDRNKQELAKDVSSLANADGGLIVLGFKTKQEPITAGDQVEAVNVFPIGLVNPVEYGKLLQSWTYPPLADVDIRIFPDPADPDRCVAAILVDTARLRNSPPFLVSKVVEEDRINGALVAYYERVQDQATLAPKERIQQWLANGRSGSALTDRLTSIERAISKLTSPAPESTERQREAVERERIKKARLKVGRDEQPIIYFAARSEPACDFPTLFESRQERLVRLIDRTPRLRPNGFGLWTGDWSEMAGGELRRNHIDGYRLMEFWRDGEVIFIGPGDEDLLGYVTTRDSSGPITINNFVLAELTLSFCWLLRFVFSEAVPQPESLVITLGVDNLTRGDEPARLSQYPEGQRIASCEEPKKAESNGCAVFQRVSWGTFDPEVAAAKLLIDLYNWFGYESSKVPFIDRSGPEPRLPAQGIAGRPLPDDPFENSNS